MLTSLRNRIEGLRRDGFARASALMLSGTVLSQAIPFALAPILTRLYPAAAYGHFAVFSLIAYTISALASLRYELAILNADDDDEAVSLFHLSALLTIGMGVIATATPLALRFVLADPDSWYSKPGSIAIGLMATLMGLFQALNYWQLRRRQFRTITASRVARAIAIGISNVTLGIISKSDEGLIWSSIFGQAVSTSVLLVFTLRAESNILGLVQFHRIRSAARRHARFAMYSVPADLLSTLTAQAPLWLLSIADRGYFSFTMTILGAPLTLVSGTFVDTFKEQATREYREVGTFRPTYVRLFRILVALSVGPTALLLAFGPDIFGFVFGQNWRPAGEFARVLALMFGIRLITNPLSYSYFVVGRQREDLLLHVYIGASTVLLLWAGGQLGWSGTQTMVAYSANYFVFYAVFLARSWQFSHIINAVSPRV
jgi:O-antigen/teichoic acid export membrane protein